MQLQHHEGAAAPLAPQHFGVPCCLGAGKLQEPALRCGSVFWEIWDRKKKAEFNA